MASTVVRQYVIDDLGDLFFQTIDKVGWVIGLMLDVSELFLPNTSQLTTFQQFLVDGVDELDSGRSSHQVFSLALDIVALEERLYNAGA